MKVNETHHFHIPVMGIGFTIDTPLKVSPYGIASAISLVDDGLMEKMRAFYCAKFEKPYLAISKKEEDFRARRITAYLNLIDTLVKEKFAALKKSVFEQNGGFRKYLDLLPNFSELKQKFQQLADAGDRQKIQHWIEANLKMGAIDVNIMTKVDKANFHDHQPLAAEFNDAHAAIRGFAESTLESSVIFSAGMNPRLYGYLESFKGFYPDEKGECKKKITLKVSDYRSALIQGKFLAKKGLWVSEYRIESGLNCGGHAFPADGMLLGPILDEFKNSRSSLAQTTFELYSDALKNKGLQAPQNLPAIKITAQGGVGTAAEQCFLLEHYGLDSVGWGTPFLLVPEVTNVDKGTLELLKDATEKDLYLSDISPLGVRFNSIRQNTKELEKQRFIEKGRPGSSCPKKYLALSTEFSAEGTCTASREYQHLKIKELKTMNLSPVEYEKAYARIVDKTCICVGLGTSALLVNNLDTKVEGEGVSICPGPNLSHFSEIVSLKEMTDHIYGRVNLIKRAGRPNLFIKELRLNIDFLKEKMEETARAATDKQLKYLATYRENLNQGIEYYLQLIRDFKVKFDESRGSFVADLERLKAELNDLKVAGETNVVEFTH
jgi:hypothetical protein